MWFLSIVACGAIAGVAQQSGKLPDKPLTLDEAIDFALANYPAVRASMQRANASREAVSLSRTAYLPRTDLLAEIARDGPAPCEAPSSPSSRRSASVGSAAARARKRSSPLR